MPYTCGFPLFSLPDCSCPTPVVSHFSASLIAHALHLWFFTLLPPWLFMHYTCGWPLIYTAIISCVPCQTVVIDSCCLVLYVLPVVIPFGKSCVSLRLLSSMFYFFSVKSMFFFHRTWSPARFLCAWALAPCNIFKINFNCQDAKTLHKRSL